MQALQDPALVQAVTSHDYAAVQSNPQIQKLMSNPKMQALLQKLATQQQQQNSSSQSSQ
jgi:Holliday junction resolvasome RuvABC DNA-binding subunit